MNIIYRILLLTTIFYGKIICDDAEPAKPNYDLTIYVNGIPPLQIESKNIHECKISEICKQIHDELNKDENIKRFCVDYPGTPGDDFKKMFDNIGNGNCTLEKYKKKDGDDGTYNYFLEFYKDSNTYDDIKVDNLANIKEIYLINPTENPNYKVIIEDSDIYDNSKVEFKNNVKKMIETIPFKLEFCHKNILKTILKENTIGGDNFDIDDIEIDNNEIKVKVKIEKTKENACYKKITLGLGLEVEVEAEDYFYYNYNEISKNENLFYKDFKNKYKFTLDEIKEIFKLKNTYFLIKNDENILYEVGNNTIGLYNTKKIIIKSIIYQTKDQNGIITENEQLETAAGGKITPITVYTDYDKIIDFLYDLSSLLHLNLYEHHEIYDNTNTKITDDNNLYKLCKIIIDKDSLKSKYDVEYKVDNKDEKKELYFSEDKQCEEICRLIVCDKEAKNFILKVEGGNSYTYKDTLPSSKPDKTPMKYTLEPVEKEERKQIDFTGLKKDSIKIDDNAGKDVKISNMEELIDSNDKLYKENTKIEGEVSKFNNALKEKKGCYQYNR